MIVRTRFSGDREVRFAEFGSSAVPLPYDGMINGGVPVALERAVGIPAVGGAIWLVAEAIGAMPMIVYTGAGGTRARAEGSWQWERLHVQPGSESTVFDFYTDISACVDSCGNAFILKRKDRRRVAELEVLNPEQVRCYQDRQTGEKKFDIATVGGRIVGLTTADVLHVRGFTFKGGIVGLSPVSVYRSALGSAIQTSEFQGRYFQNDARPGLVIKTPQAMTHQQAKEWRDMWDSVHAGPGNRGKTSVLGGGMELEVLPMSAEDAQFVESQQFTVREAARMFRVPPTLLGDGDAADVRQEVQKLLKFALMPRMRRIEQAFMADPDLFGVGSTLTPEFLADALLRADTLDRFEAYRRARQGGWISANEIRDLENYPPKDGGDEIQLTPVGGAPNQQPAEADPDPVGAALNGTGD